MKTDTMTKTAGLSLAALLVLSACGSGEEGTETADDNGNGEAQEQAGSEENVGQLQDEHVYQFDQFRDDYDGPEPQNPSAGEEVTVQLPDWLAEQVPEDNPMLVESYTLISKAVNDEYCRVDIDISYTEGAVETILDRSPGDRDRPNIMWFTNQIEADHVDALPADEDLRLGEGPAAAAGENYIMNDHSAMTIVGLCSDDLETPIAITRLKFPGPEDGIRGTTFAEVNIAVLGDDDSMAFTSPSLPANTYS